MEDIEIGLWVAEIVAISVSIVSASIIMWKLFWRRWRLEKRERLVSETVIPLFEEVNENVRRLKKMELGVQVDDALISEVGNVVNKSGLWEAFASRNIKGQVKFMYAGIREYGMYGHKATRRYWEILKGVLNERLFKEEEDARRFSGKTDVIVQKMYHFGFGLYFVEGWDVVRDQFYDDVSNFVKVFCDESSDVSRVSVSAEDVLRAIGIKVKQDVEIESFGFLRSNLIKTGDILIEGLSRWKIRELESLYGRVVEE